MARKPNEAGVRIRRAKVDSLCIYEVTEEELDELEKGSPDSLYLLFSIFFLTEATTFLIVLLTVQIASTSKSFVIFGLLTIVGFALGIVLLVLWLRGYLSSTSVVKKIRHRLEDEIIPLTVSSIDPTSNTIEEFAQPIKAAEIAADITSTSKSK